MQSYKPSEPRDFLGSFEGDKERTYWVMSAVFWASSSYEPLEPREGRPRHPNKAH